MLTRFKIDCALVVKNFPASPSEYTVVMAPDSSFDVVELSQALWLRGWSLEWDPEEASPWVFREPATLLPDIEEIELCPRCGEFPDAALAPRGTFASQCPVCDRPYYDPRAFGAQGYTNTFRAGGGFNIP